jgi:hypothetical protein
VHRSSGTCPPGMVLHIKDYALHGLISPRHHSNVNHISSLNLSNICMKSLTNHLRAQRHYTDPLYKAKETKRQPIGLIPTRNGKFPPMNIMGRLVMRPPILLVRSCIYLFHFFLGSLSFLSRGFLLPSRGSPGRSISRFSFSYGFYLLPAAFTPWAFSPFFPQDKMYPGRSS